MVFVFVNVLVLCAAKRASSSVGFRFGFRLGFRLGFRFRFRLGFRFRFRFRFRSQSHRQCRLPDLLLPAEAVGEGTAASGGLVAADAGEGGEHSAQLDEAGITSFLDVLKRVVSHAFTTFESGVGDA